MIEEQVGDGTYNIPESNYPKFEKAIEKLSKKSVKLTGEAITPIVFGYEMKDVGNGQQIKVYQVLLGGPSPKLNGWSFLGRIDHANKELGNIVRVVPGKSIPSLYRDRPCTCDHCNINRFRRETFVVKHDETGETKQVGSACLKDFLGHSSPEKIAKLAELLGYADEAARGYTNVTGEDRRYINLEMYLAHVARLVRQHNFYVTRTRAKETGEISTADQAYTDMTVPRSYYVAPSDEDVTLAEQAVEWAQSFGDNGEQLNDFQHNLKVIAASGVIDFRSLGFAASIVGGFMREMNARKERKASTSVHLGEVGGKVTVTATLKMVKHIETQYGESIMHRFETDEGNVLTTFTGRKLGEEGDRVQLTAKVKKHDEYKGTKSTIVSHAKVQAI